MEYEKCTIKIEYVDDNNEPVTGLTVNDFLICGKEPVAITEIEPGVYINHDLVKIGANYYTKDDVFMYISRFITSFRTDSFDGLTEEEAEIIVRDLFKFE